MLTFRDSLKRLAVLYTVDESTAKVYVAFAPCTPYATFGHLNKLMFFLTHKTL